MTISYSERNSEISKLSNTTSIYLASTYKRIKTHPETFSNMDDISSGSTCRFCLKLLKRRSHQEINTEYHLKYDERVLEQYLLLNHLIITTGDP